LATARAQALITRHRLTVAVLDRARPSERTDASREVKDAHDLVRQAAEDLAAFRASWEDPQRWASVRQAQSEADHHEIEYLRRLPRAKREERLRQMDLRKAFECRLRIEELRQASRRKKRSA
jgi:hypothetical protein